MRYFLGMVFLGLTAFTVTSCRRGSESAQQPEQSGLLQEVAFRNQVEPVEFTGSAVCASCHEEEFQSFADHGMANSMQRVIPERLFPEFPSPGFYHEGTRSYYWAFRSGDRFFQQEFRLGAEGDTTHQLTREMAWVVGSGTAARTYVTVENDRYLEMPLTWFTQRRVWDFSPGFEIINSRFGRVLPSRCVACHADYPEAVPEVPGKYLSMPEGIGCERCHGPGALHVEVRLENPEPTGKFDDTIVNTDYLSLDRRLDLCQQCHLSAPVNILREGRGPFDFQPGDTLSAHIALFSKVTGDPERFTVVSHAKLLKRSACFRGSLTKADQMDCTTCHDPHLGYRTAGSGYFNAKCEGCHDTAVLPDRVASDATQDHIAGTNCSSCHMPKRIVSGVPHSSFTDHWIRVVRADEKPLQGRQPTTEGELASYYPGDQGSIYEGIAHVVLGIQKSDSTALRRGARLLEANLTAHQDFGEAHFQLGHALFALADFDSAVEPLETAVRLDPDVPERLNALALLYERLGRSTEKVDGLYRRALEIQPMRADIRVNYGRFLETQGHELAAIKQYKFAIEENPSMSTAHYNVGTAMIRQGELLQAEKHLREAIHLDPEYTQAYGNLAVVLATQGRKDEAQLLFELAVEGDPDDPVALNNLASFYLNIGEDSTAVPFLRKAVSSQPDYVEALANLALALLRVGNDQEASAYALKVLELDPDNMLASHIARALK